MQDQEFNTCLIEAAKAGNLDDVNKYLDKGADIDFKSPVGYGICTALGFAMAGGYVAVVRRLLQRGADPEIQCTVPDPREPGKMIVAKALVQSIELMSAELFHLLINFTANVYDSNYFFSLSKRGVGPAIKEMESALETKILNEGMPRTVYQDNANERAAKCNEARRSSGMLREMCRVSRKIRIRYDAGNAGKLSTAESAGPEKLTMNIKAGM